VLRWAGHTLSFWGDYDRALTVLEKATRLNVNGSQVLNSLGWVMVYACVEPDRAILHFERAMRLSPRDPEIGIMLNGIACVGTFRTSRDVRLESGMHTKEDVRRRPGIYGFTSHDRMG
jgi:Flp pilus assembly protein TadD